jgi:hypothetical protein
VIVSQNTFKVGGNAANEKEYFIVIHKDDESNLLKKKHINENEFIPSHTHDTIERDLSAAEVSEFKILAEIEYDRIHHNEDGRVYEQKKESFKSYYNRIEMICMAIDVETAKHPKEILKSI